VLDANVIVQALVRDLLLDADAFGLCRVRWTEAILAEAQRTLIRDFGRDPARIDALLAAMRRHFPRAAIVGYEERIAAMTYDPNDRHVAAYIRVTGRGPFNDPAATIALARKKHAEQGKIPS